ncbi:MAG: hypothetical protein OEV66_05205 [Spirochaetia bacterium]|nr:hypothetical protein [Spirochaetia bacterium]
MKRKKTRYLIFIWSLGILAYSIERYYLNDHINMNKFKEYAAGAGDTVNEVDRKLSGLIASGSLNYLIWMEGHISDELNMVKSIHPLIQDVMIYNSGFHMLAGTRDKLSDMNITPLLEESVTEKKHFAYVCHEGLLYFYPVFNGRENKLKGIIAVILKYPAYLQNGSIFLTDVTRGNIFQNSPGYLNNDNIYKLQKYLSRLEMGEQGHVSVNLSSNQDLFWYFSKSQNVYIGYISDAIPSYKFLYPYILVLCLMLSLLLWFSGAPRTNKHAVYEKIINDHMKTLAEMKKGMDLLFQNNSASNIVSIDATISSSISDIEEGVPAYHHRPEKEYAGSGISEFILLDPLDAKWRKPVRAKHEISESGIVYRSGKEAFTPELLHLMEEVSRKDRKEKEDGLEKMQLSEEQKDEDISTGFRSIEKDPFAAALEQLYSATAPGEELDIVLEYIKQSAKADGLAIMFYDRDIACYSIATANGLDSSWERHFYILAKDSILRFPDNETGNILVDERLLQNSFFRKRIPPEFLNKTGAIKLVPLKSGEVTIAAVFFYWRDGHLLGDASGGSMELLKAVDTPEFTNYFNEIIPVLNRMYVRRQQENIHIEEPYRDIYNIVKSFTVLSDESANIIHVVSDRFLDKEVSSIIREHCRNFLKSYERFIVSSPNHYIFLLSQTPPENVLQIIERLDDKAQIRTLKFPDLGKNLFAYI